ncbi:MAG: OmpA family protein [Thermotogales bacterium]|nr:OmpA family protein [Thermotogales bacterium]
MKNIHTTKILVLAVLGMSSGWVQAADGYVDDSSTNMVRTGYGDCMHTKRWSVPNAIMECDPEIVAKRDGVDMAAVQVVLRMKRNPVHLQADALFSFDSDAISDTGAVLLDDLVGNLTAVILLEQKIEIIGHTDRIGNDAYNLALSKRRAESVRSYLVAKGVVPRYIETKGMGSAEPVVECPGIRGQALIDCLAPNRRTEVEISAIEEVEVKEEAPVEKAPIPVSK